MTKGLYQDWFVSREDCERLPNVTVASLFPEHEPRKIAPLELIQQQKLEEKRRWFEMVKTEFLKDHRPLESGKSWREEVLGEAEKYKDELPIAARILRLGASKKKSSQTLELRR